jgi:hypothetical protein
MIIILGIIAGILAFKIGKLRHSCIYWAERILQMHLLVGKNQK